MRKEEIQVIFYDGDCGFCNHAIQYILKHRKNDNFQFIALQSDLAKQKLKDFQIKISLSTIYLLDNQKVYDRSTAALKIASKLKFPNNLMGVFLLIPAFMRNWVYVIIAKNRHKIKPSYCYLPDEKESKMFLS
ncbi:thiol-disulfide oxidoreductase DCC family protein [Putridiphycobacter roseus]|nr:DUF393 domain-containing protein [Putridiphycobacter roseus]